MNARDGAVDSNDGDSGAGSMRPGAPRPRVAACALIALAMASGTLHAARLPGLSETLVSNIDETSSETLTVGAIDDDGFENRRVAVRFHTGSGYGRGFNLDRLRLKTSIDPNHSGRTPMVVATIHGGGTATTPGPVEATFLPQAIKNGVMTFDALHRTLAENRWYWLHLSTRNAYTSFNVHLTSSGSESGRTGWSINDASRFTEGSFHPKWDQDNQSSDKSVQFESTGTRSPEDSSRSG